MDSHRSATEIGRDAMRRFLADLAARPHRRITEPAHEPEPEIIRHPDWFRGAWHEALGARTTTNAS